MLGPFQHKCGYCGWLFSFTTNFLEHECFKHYVEDEDRIYSHLLHSFRTHILIGKASVSHEAYFLRRIGYKNQSQIRLAFLLESTIEIESVIGCISYAFLAIT